ncbi:helix-turn-helix domain-containing protein [Micromonospora sp. LOL_024]|uniref:helix-turn-helix domain-containing protein n=1 Tax=Micromonospora sp. LOL_024 TaxID=3345412 RepID=UPI003A88652A
MTSGHDRPSGPPAHTGLPELLRAHRLAVGSTQADLAARAGVGVRTVRDLERGRSLRPQRTTVELLAGALGLAGADRRAFLAAARGGGTATPQPDVAPPPGLPPPPELIGRERDVAELSTLLTESRGPRVVSLVGLAGVGKTALALAVVHAVAPAHPGGTAGVLIGAGSDAADVLAASMTVFGAARVTELAARLGGRPALLLVDAAERTYSTGWTWPAATAASGCCGRRKSCYTSCRSAGADLRRTGSRGTAGRDARPAGDGDGGADEEAPCCHPSLIARATHCAPASARLARVGQRICRGLMAYRLLPAGFCRSFCR